MRKVEHNVKTCDNPGCGKTEEKGNHWFRVGLTLGLIMLTRAEKFKVGVNGKIVKAEWHDACGRRCANEMVAAWMGEADPT